MALQGETHAPMQISPNDLLTETVWRPAQGPATLDLETPGFDGGIAWFDVRSNGDAAELFEFLGPRCDGLTLSMVSDLLEPDRRPQGERYGDGELRLASTFAVYPTKTKNDLEGDWSCPLPSADLIYQPVELLSNGDWLLTCWHPREKYRGYDRVGDPQSPRRHPEIARGVEKRWCAKNASTAADLGVLVMHELALTYAPAHRQLYAALEDWELKLYGLTGEQDETGEIDADTPRALWSARARLLDWLGPLNIPGLNEDLDKAWLPATDHDEVKLVDKRVDKALDALKTLGVNLRSGFHSLQAQTAERQRERNEVRQQRIERLATLFLIPTLIVGLAGANTWIPGQQRHWGFEALLVFMFVATAMGWIWISKLRNAENLRLPTLSWRGRAARQPDDSETRS
jgi:Mg2+ and Co2+ transporter CorA